jgi:hypothetical protein
MHEMQQRGKNEKKNDGWSVLLRLLRLNYDLLFFFFSSRCICICSIQGDSILDRCCPLIIILYFVGFFRDEKDSFVRGSYRCKTI